MLRFVTAALLLVAGYALGASGVVPHLWRQLLESATASATPTATNAQNTGSKELAGERARLIEELSGDRVLRLFTDQIRDEVRAFVSGNGQVSASRDDGRWHPDVAGIGAELLAGFESSFDRGVSMVRGNRRVRRTAKSIVGTGSRRRRFSATLFDSQVRVADFCASHGIPRTFADTGILPRLARGRLTAEQLQLLLERELFSPTKFIGYYIDSFEKDQRIRDRVRDVGRDLAQTIATWRRNFEELRPQLSHDAERRHSEPVRFTQLRTRILDGYCEELGISSGDAIPTPQGTFPGLDLVVSCAQDLFNDANPAGPVPRPVRFQDATDLFHAFYAPYVDLWRGDRYSCALVMRQKACERVRAVPRMAELPKAIEKLG
jgi:hypothetical protein